MTTNSPRLGEVFFTKSSHRLLASFLSIQKQALPSAALELGV